MRLGWYFGAVAVYVLLFLWLGLTYPAAAFADIPVGVILLGGFYLQRNRYERKIRTAVDEECEAGWPTLSGWAREHGWQLRRIDEVPWTEHLRHRAEPGPYLTVSGEVDGRQVDVMRMPFVDHGGVRPRPGVHHVAVVRAPARPDTTFRTWRTRGFVVDGVLVTVVENLNFELRPEDVLVGARFALTALQRQDAGISPYEKTLRSQADS